MGADEPGRHVLDQRASVIDAGASCELPWMLADLADRGVGRLMAGGGGRLHTQFLTANLADELHLAIAGLTPKLIARKVGIPVSAASRMVAAIAAKRPPSDMVTDCWVSPGWSRALDGVAGRRWPDAEVSETGPLGLVAVLLARPHRHDRVSVCGYLVDVHCLGVKNAVGPRVMDQRELLAFRRSFFAGFHADPVPAPVELAQHLVLGAVEYARGLGFEPHPDFAAAARHLGDWAGPSDITFGREGKPCYVQGPHDNPTAVIQTLNRTVGQGNYEYVIAVA